jgi:hypothetical protein
MVRLELRFKGADGELVEEDELPEMGDEIKFTHKVGYVTKIVETVKDGYEVFTVTVDGDAPKPS